jgi:predicted kinase
MSRLIHLNGPPGIGKSTLARRYAEEHPGVLNCDVDVLRTLIGGWRDDFAHAGALIRPAALAMIEAYLRSGNDVVFPQMLIDPAELARFEQCATSAGAQFIERVLMDTSTASVARFHRRGQFEPDEPWHDHVRTVVAAAGGDATLARDHAALELLVAERPDAVMVHSREGEIDATYRSLIETLS